jgi:hypothetical protein
MISTPKKINKMSDQTVAFQAKIYVYDLQNCAREFGFKADEGWEVSMATGPEKKALENKYFPTMAIKVLPEILAQLLASVKLGLSVQLTSPEKNMDINSIRNQQLQYLFAYSPNRLRR